MNILQHAIARCSIISFFILSLSATTQAVAAKQPIKIGADLAITGPLAGPVGDIRKGISLALEEVNQEGGVTIGRTKYPVKFIEYDNQFNKSEASKVAMNAMAKDRVTALILPLFSDFSIQVAGLANSYKVPAVAANSTSSKITEGNKYAFRTSASYTEMAKATLKLAQKEWQAKKIAVLYDELNGYSSKMAKTLVKEFTAVHGTNSVVAVEIFRKGNTKSDGINFKRPLQKIIAAEPDFLYIPQYPEQIAAIVKEARALGWDKPITGSNTWGTPDLIEKCGNSCKGLFYVGNFVEKGSTGKMLEFSKKYKTKYNETPTSSAASGYDAFKIIIKALESLDNLSDNLAQNRKKLRAAIAKTQYEGATGKIFYPQASGEPVKCPIVIKVDDNGEFVQHFVSCSN